MQGNSNFIGIAVSALVVTAVMLLLARVYGFSASPEHANPLPAPQANAMAAIISFIMETSDATKWFLIAVGVSLLFSAVSSWAVAMISVTPISGMTLMTLIVSAVLLRYAGLTGREGMLGVLLIGGVVCACLSTSGTLVTEFKVGYWVGATPKK